MHIIVRLVRPIVLLCCVVIIIFSFSLWMETGRATFTRLYDAQRAADEASSTTGLADLFDGTTSSDQNAGERIEAVPNRFALGLAPAAYPWQMGNAESVSVLTLAGPAALIALLQLAPMKKRAKRGEGGHRTD